ncbi:MAG: hypothetical protein KC649_00160 [Candidatus Omnitrophica bacterium]|nr:hypothetical protein [Candidatus Omnitrophota bacterium]
MSLAFFADARLDQFQTHSQPSGMMMRFLGKATEVVGDAFYQRADVYFHGGVKSSDHDEDEEAYAARQHGSEEADHEEQEVSAESESSNWIRRLNQRIKVHEHQHLKTKAQEAEILPWIWVATRLNPHNIDAILSAAYWLGFRLDKQDEAVDILRKGIRNNPSSWQLHQAIANLYFQKKSDYQNASAYYSTALKLASQDEADEVTQRTSVIMRYQLAESLYHTGEFRAALKQYQTALTLLDPEMPLRQTIQTRIDQIIARSS